MQVDDNGLLDRNDLKRLSLMVEVFLDPGQACFDKGLGGSTMLSRVGCFVSGFGFIPVDYGLVGCLLMVCCFTWEINQYFDVGIKNIKPV